ncbi:nuclear transport factor 2 family protein [Streptomyces coffeae]|uniref:Nuclear transport factor 2 family protein n=1 Tax=Streptomyces coffeae TaxID=621382 RepID=A0ABS1NGX3_9ACTN|nr:nuclear transport factor 2 family protein [Streptomyces coffeae]MBL1099321.1 nuclear transport factor 2 family protein [Streptomyces coffeae]
MSSSAADYNSLMRRVRVLEDKEALRTLMIRGWRALDLKDWETWIACWADDATLEFGPWETIRGKEAIRATVERAESAYPSMQHHILNMHIAIEDENEDRATGIGYMWFVAVTEPGRTASPYSMGGPYAWEFSRGRDGWLLTRQRLGVWWTHGEDTRKAFA